MSDKAIPSPLTIKALTDAMRASKYRCMGYPVPEDEYEARVYDSIERAHTEALVKLNRKFAAAAYRLGIPFTPLIDTISPSLIDEPHIKQNIFLRERYTFDTSYPGNHKVGTQYSPAPPE